MIVSPSAARVATPGLDACREPGSVGGPGSCAAAQRSAVE
jgi:hypothetical protein